jgi:RNA polymerase primary sigma factor
MLPPPASLDALLDEDSTTSLGELLADPDAEDPDERVDRELLADAMSVALAGLSERERLVLLLHYGFDGQRERTLTDVGRDLNVTRERARQIKAAAMSKLRSAENVNRLRNFVQ